MESYLELLPPANELQEIVESAKDWALLNGLCIRSYDNFNKDLLKFVNFTLLPAPLPREVYSEACEIQTLLNELIHRVAHDYDFLKETLQQTIKVDIFTKKLFDLYETVRNEGFAQEISLGLFRSDFMLDNHNKKSWKQIEMNTIASGCGWLGPCTTKIHKFVSQEMGMESLLQKIPDNKALEGLCLGIIEAWRLYNDERAGILFVVEDVTVNIFDQRAHEFEIKRQNPNIRVFRRSLTQLVTATKLGVNKELTVDGNIIAVVYYRSGYAPGQYSSEEEWNVRLMIERSKAIKCPSIQYHLAGTKKVQQVLTQPGILEKFFDDEQTACRVRKIFTGMYSLDFTEEGDRAVEMAIANPAHFVLKPQREGGGNNIFDSKIRSMLKTFKENEERLGWILMDKICPPSHYNYFIRPESNSYLERIESLCEVGIFGVIIGDSRNIYVNKHVGYLARTKPVYANEGGIWYEGAVSSLYLV